MRSFWKPLPSKMALFWSSFRGVTGTNGPGVEPAVTVGKGNKVICKYTAKITLTSSIVDKYKTTTN